MKPSLIKRIRLYIRRRWERIKPYKPLEFWEKRGESYPEKMKDKNFRAVTREHRAVVTEMLNEVQAERFIEVGCGSGRLFDLYLRFPHVVGVDMSWSMLDNSKAVKERLEFRQMNLVRASATDLPFASESFDCALTSEVLLHIPPQKVASALDEIMRVSRYAIFLEFYTPTYEDSGELREKRKELASWNFLHAYPSLFEELQLRVIRQVELRSTPQTCFLVTREL